MSMAPGFNSKLVRLEVGGYDSILSELSMGWTMFQFQTGAIRSRLIAKISQTTANEGSFNSKLVRLEVNVMADQVNSDSQHNVSIPNWCD